VTADCEARVEAAVPSRNPSRTGSCAREHTRRYTCRGFLLIVVNRSWRRFVEFNPIGLQLLGKALDEARIFQIAHAYEQSTDWHKARPKL